MKDRCGGTVEFVFIIMTVFNGYREGKHCMVKAIQSLSGDGLILAVGHEISDYYYGYYDY